MRLPIVVSHLSNFLNFIYEADEKTITKLNLEDFIASENIKADII